MKNLNNVTVERIHLWYYNPSMNSDKVYNIELEHDPVSDTYSVYFEYGRRGQNLRPGYKVQGVNKGQAITVMYDLKNQKENKGYDLQAHDTNLQQVNVAPYLKICSTLHKDGILTDNEKNKLDSFLLCNDPETINLAVDILSARRAKAEMANAA